LAILNRLGSIDGGGLVGSELVRTLDQLCDEQPFRTAWYLKDVRSGEVAARDGDLAQVSASTRKIPILMTVLNDVHAGRLSLDQPIRADGKYQLSRTVVSGSGCLNRFRPGFTLTLSDYLTMMIIVSDNTSRDIVMDVVGLARINEYSRAVGMENTAVLSDRPEGLPLTSDTHAYSATTANDMGNLLDLVLRGCRDPQAADTLGVSPDLCRYAIDTMKSQQLATRLPYLLPPSAKIAHKTGNGRREYTEFGVVFHAYSDVGIVFDREEPCYILAVYTDDVASVLDDGRAGRGAAELHIARLGRTSWEHIVQGSAQAAGSPRW
jgi:beta-lactamase class A